MPRNSAGILMYQLDDDGLRVLLAHPGGPFWRNRDEGAWSVPKGEADTGEAPEQVARREFHEELGTAIVAPLTPLGRLRQRGGKWVEAFAVEGEFDVASLRSNEFPLEWPPRSGKTASFPEVDRVAWFAPAEARRKILPSQQVLIDRLQALLGLAVDGDGGTG